ncbi:hypothetical protein F1640_22035 [Novosphingobium sp. NBM11]|nr:hypothetical protein [Novosphingobium sp. NBM11]RQW44318.1 hypothetical protein EH199_08800 [Novosphingobium sp. LASN5T]
MFGADRIAVQRIEHRIAPLGLGGVVWRQHDEHRPVRRLAFQIAFERRAVDRDGLHRQPRRAGDDRRTLGHRLGKRRGRRETGADEDKPGEKTFPIE